MSENDRFEKLIRINFGMLCFKGKVISGQRLVHDVKEVMNEVDYLASKNGCIIAAVESSIENSDVRYNWDTGEAYTLMGDGGIWVGQPESILQACKPLKWHKKYKG